MAAGRISKKKEITCILFLFFCAARASVLRVTREGTGILMVVMATGLLDETEFCC